MKLKKFIAILSMVAMIGTLAVGCGKSNEESKHNNCCSIDLPDRYEHNRLAWQTSRS